MLYDDISSCINRLDLIGGLELARDVFIWCLF